MIFWPVEIPDLTLIPEIHDEPVFDGYRKGGVTRDRQAGVTGENCQKTIFDCDAVAEINSKMPSGHLLQFALPCKNAKHPQERCEKR